MKRRLLSWVLAVVMVCTMLPVRALASVAEHVEAQPAAETYTHINPLYADVLTEADLVKPSDQAAADTNAVSQSEYAATFAEAGAQIRDGMIQRQETVVAYYRTETYDSANHKDIFNAAVAHTGAPKAGDSLRWVYGGYSVSISRYSLEGVYYVTYTYTMTYYTTAEQEAQMDAAVESLLAELAPSGTDYEKLSTVYDYMCANIVYDYENLEDTAYKLKYTAYAALINKTSVCQGYAALLYRLALEMGIDCRMITGTGNGGGHAWNIVKLNDVYYNADATWDASWMQGVGYYNYYLQCEDTFTEGGTDHIRDAEYDTEEFLAAYPISETDFDPAVDNVSDIASGTCGEGVTWSLSADGVLTISGKGAMEDYARDSVKPWNDYEDQITSVLVRGTVSKLGSYALFRLDNLTQVTLEEGVTAIGERAMYDCGSLTSVVIPASISDMGEGVFLSDDALATAGPIGGDYNVRFGWTESIPANAFAGLNYALKAVTLPETLTSIGDSAFAGCRALYTIDLPDGLVSIGADAFSGSGIKVLDMPDSVTELGSYAFFQTYLTRVVLSENLEVISEGAFSNCTSLKEVELGGAVTISAEAFDNCWSLPEIVFPASVEEIGADAFATCSALATITFEGSFPVIHETAFTEVTARAYYPGEDATWTAEATVDYGGTLTWSPVGVALIIASGTCGENITWTLDEFYHLEITGTGDMPDWESGMAPWDDYNQDICSVTISDCITSVGSYAFFHNYDLASVEMPDSVTRIGQSAFSGCNVLAEVDLPDYLVTIEDYAFSSTDVTGIEFPATLVTIGKAAFHGAALTTARIPEGVTSVGSHAFCGCPLTKLTIPASLTDIGYYAFGNCAPLAYIQVDENNPVYCNDSQGAMYSIDRSTLIVVPAGFSGHFVIPVSVTSIASNAFDSCSSMTEVTIPNSVTEMGGEVFWNCDGLTQLTFPDSMTVIPSAFAACSENLTRVTIPETVTQIEDMAFFDTGLTQIDLPDGLTAMGISVFQSCEALTSIEIPAGITVLPEGTLMGCTALTEVILPETMTALEPHCFNGCTALTEIDLPDGLTSIGSCAFYDCTALASITIPAGVTAIADNTFNDCDALTEVDLPAGLLSVDHHAFYGCDNLKSISIPDAVTAIPDYTFAFCTALTEIDLPDDLESLGLRAFWSCEDLKHITLPAGVTAIGDYCFSGSGLEGITFTGHAPVFNGSYVFLNVTAAAYYPAQDATWTEDVMLDYGGTISWVAYEYEGVTSGTCGEHAAWDLTDGVLTISGSGDMDDYDCAQEQPWYDQGDSITAIVVEGTVNSVGEYAFSGLANLVSVTIGEGVTDIGGHAMQDCPVLSAVRIPATVTAMWEKTFAGCPKLTNAGPSDAQGEAYGISFGWTDTIPAYAFHGMDGLTHVAFPAGLETIGNIAFTGSGLTEVVIPDCVTDLGIEAFRDTPLASVVYGANLAEIPYKAFSGCDQLTSFAIPEGVTHIGGYAFEGCTALTEIVIPANVTDIFSQAFAYCTGLNKVKFLGSAPDFYYDAFIGVEADVYYPASDATWTADVTVDYEGQLTWIPYEEKRLTITKQPVDYVGQVGDLASFTVVAEGEGLTYQWYFSADNGAVWQKSSCQTNTLTIEFKAYRNNYLYYCVVTDSAGNCVASDTVKLTGQKEELVILTQPVSYTGAVNDNASFFVEAAGNGLRYEWFFSKDAGVTWSKSYSPGYQTNTLSPVLRAHRDGNLYKCVITDLFGDSVTSDTVCLSVKASDVVITVQPADVENAILGQLYTFTVEATGDNLAYRWQVSSDDGATWEESWNQGYNTATLNVRMNANRDGNLYRCVITSGLKIVHISEAAVLDLQDPSARIVSQSGNTVLVANQIAVITVKAEGTDLTYQWYRSNDKGATWAQTYLAGYNTDTLSFTANPNRAAMYMCKVTDGSGKAVWSEPVKLQILSDALRILKQPVSMTCAEGETASFAVEALGDTLKYQWYASADNGATWAASYMTGYNTAAFSFVVNSDRAARLYKCVITDAAGNTVETDPVKVTIV